MSAWTEARDRQMIADGWVKRPDGYWEQPKVKLGPNYADPSPPPKAPKRIRQSSKPLMNKLESEFWEHLRHQWSQIVIQSIRFKLGNGIWYKPDFVVWPIGLESQDTHMRVYEVKGPFAHRGGFENLKVAAGLYPVVSFYLVWKEKGDWKEQRILP